MRAGKRRDAARGAGVSACPGTGKPWQGGTGHPICPVCHRGVVSITGVRRSMKQVRGKAVPEHERRTR